jgi:hypothetical protein
MRVGPEAIRLPMVLVRCRRCHRPAGRYCEDARGVGEWHYRDREACSCDPPPVLPDGPELARLVKLARRKGQRADGKAPVQVTR